MAALSKVASVVAFGALEEHVVVGRPVGQFEAVSDVLLWGGKPIGRW
jgi:hypothetical protein